LRLGSLIWVVDVYGPYGGTMSLKNIQEMDHRRLLELRRTIRPTLVGLVRRDRRWRPRMPMAYHETVARALGRAGTRRVQRDLDGVREASVQYFDLGGSPLQPDLCFGSEAAAGRFLIGLERGFRVADSVSGKRR